MVGKGNKNLCTFHSARGMKNTKKEIKARKLDFAFRFGCKIWGCGQNDKQNFEGKIYIQNTW